MDRNVVKKRVLHVVNNSITFDSRVKKEAHSLEKAGFDVTILGRYYAPELGLDEEIDNVKYIRAKGNDLKDFFKAFLKVHTRDYKHLLYLTPNRLFCGLLAIAVSPIYLFLIIPKLILNIVNLFLNKDLLKKYDNYLFDLIRKVSKYFFLPILMFEGVTLSLAPYILKIKPDIIHCHDLETLRVGHYCAKILGSKLIYDSHEFERDRNDRAGFFQRIQIILEERAYIHAVSFIVTVSEDIGNLLQKIYKIAKPIILHNTPHSDIKPGITHTIRDSIKNIGSNPLLVYVGLITTDRALNEILESLVYLENWHLAFIGPKSPKVVASLWNRAKELNLLKRFHILPAINSDDLPHYLKTADIGIIAIRRLCISYEYCLPNKLFEMSFAGIPILVSDLKSMKEFVLHYQLGDILPDKFNPQSIALKVKNVYSNRKIFNNNKQKSELLIKKYCWHNQIKPLIDMYNEL